MRCSTKENSSFCWDAQAVFQGLFISDGVFFHVEVWLGGGKWWRLWTVYLPVRIFLLNSNLKDMDIGKCTKDSEFQYKSTDNKVPISQMDTVINYNSLYNGWNLGNLEPVSLKGPGNVLTSSLASSSCSNIFTETCSLSIFQLSFPLFQLYFQWVFSPVVATMSTSTSRLAFYQFRTLADIQHFFSNHASKIPGGILRGPSWLPIHWGQGKQCSDWLGPGHGPLPQAKRKYSTQTSHTKKKWKAGCPKEEWSVVPKRRQPKILTDPIPNKDLECRKPSTHMCL